MVVSFICLLALVIAVLSIIITKRTPKLYGKQSDFKRINTQVKILIVIPLLAAIILSIVIYNFHSLYEERISHALIVLSGWVITTSSLFSIRYIRGDRKYSLLTLILIIFSVSMTVYLTPLNRYAAVFHKSEYVIAFVVGIGLLVVNYVNLFKIRKAGLNAN
ncbi:hypothetical protein ABEX78_23785 [Priestia megaterium]